MDQSHAQKVAIGSGVNFCWMIEYIFFDSFIISVISGLFIMFLFPAITARIHIMLEGYGVKREAEEYILTLKIGKITENKSGVSFTEREVLIPFKLISRTFQVVFFWVLPIPFIYLAAGKFDSLLVWVPIKLLILNSGVYLIAVFTYWLLYGRIQSWYFSERGFKKFMIQKKISSNDSPAILQSAYSNGWIK